ncbi:hypothetical protein H2198_003206 [Neophaeococcomyces mojaviensis]|uniref:Uncharacterized protein n=1 Tax=Neophaeococcomyces mojaviensis TaxID=3383035 RepID=A0ACC3ACI1_9EURO|nr:hypothetical protein H2198_003206 [Knufia sp. JES_112]
MDDVLPVELRTAFKLALRSRSAIAAALDEPEKRPRLPVFQDIVEAILFTRSFLPSYIAVVVIAILAWTLAKWCATYVSCLRRKRRLQNNSPASSSVASSSSSTLQGTESPPLKDDDTLEDTPLLAEAQLQPEPLRSFGSRIWCYIRSSLLHQPKPIPALTAPKNSLPPNETTIVILLFLALNLFYLFYRMPLTRAMVFAFADRAGLLFVVNLPILYVLAAKNNQPLKWLTGWSYEGLNIFHRRLGEWMTIAAVLHAIGMVIAFYDLIAPSGYTIWWYLTRRIIIFGMIAFVLYLGIYFTSIGYFRQALYEVFLVLHIFLQVTALVMLYFHHHDARPYVGAAIGIWILDRGISRIVFKTKSAIATLAIAADAETVLLHCEIPLQRPRFWQFGIFCGWHAGQHVFLTVPGMDLQHRWQAHPFTIASPAPPRKSGVDSWPLQLSIRAQDGFSRKLLEYAKLHQHAKVLLDGPYSSDDVLHAMRNSDRVCLVAGGSGIAVTYPFAWDRKAAATGPKDILHNRARYVDGVKKKPNVKRKNVIDESRFAHFWVRQEASHESWVTMLPRADSIMPTSESRLDGAEYGLDLITHRFDTRSTNTGSKERPDMKAELQAWVRDDLQAKSDKKQSVCIIVSGPDGLVRDVQNAMAGLVREGWNIEVHVEKFGW